MSDHECACGGSCGCQTSTDEISQVYLGRDEYITRLEDYLTRLKDEIKSVEEELMALRQEA